MGAAPASTMIELLPPVGWGDVARTSDLVSLRTELRGEMAELRGEMAEFRAEVRADISRLEGRIDSLLPKLVTANVASMVGIAGLVIAAARFL